MTPQIRGPHRTVVRGLFVKVVGDGVWELHRSTTPNAEDRGIAFERVRLGRYYFRSHAIEVAQNLSRRIGLPLIHVDAPCARAYRGEVHNG